MANTTSSRRRHKQRASSSKRNGIAPWRRQPYKGTMRLAFEAALKKAGYDASALEAAPPEQVMPTWTGPRDGVRA
jgi:hypothetical protein